MISQDRLADQTPAEWQVALAQSRNGSPRSRGKATLLLHGCAWLFLLAFYTGGKFALILAIPALVGLLKLRSGTNRDDTYAMPLAVILVVVACFLVSFLTALSYGNDLVHIVRNNFYTLAFVPLGFLFYRYYSDSSDVDPFLVLMYGIGVVGSAQICLYFAALLSAGFMSFYNNVLIDALGYTFAFAGRYDWGASAIKLYSNLTPLLLFIIPIALLDTRFPRWALGAALGLVLLSASVTQYVVLLIYLGAYLADCIASAVRGRRHALRRLSSVILACTIVLALVVTLGLSGTMMEKLENFANPRANEFNSVSIRARQADILMREFEQRPVLGSGLGYISGEYRLFRRHFGDVKELNQSMYENQYLDILMKFGILAIPVLVGTVLVPIALLMSYRRETGVSGKAVALGYIGMLIFAGSNGNAFYVYSTMFCWGLALAFGTNTNSVRARRGGQH